MQGSSSFGMLLPIIVVLLAYGISRMVRKRSGSSKSVLGTDSSSFSDFLSFRKMISESILSITYSIGALGLTAGGFALMTGDRYGSDERKLVGVLLVTVGNLLWRVLCESWILFFKIHAQISSIDKGIAALQKKTETPE